MKSLRQFVCQIIDGKGTIRGTGFYIHPDGYIATCHHVVENCNGKVRVGIFGESEPIESEIVIDDRDYDLAVLNIDREKCKSLPLNPEWEIGDEVFSHGFSIDHSLTFHDAGFPVDSKLIGTTTPSNRKIEVIVLDKTEVNYGLSGAPAFNRRTGRVIGILTLKYDEGRKALVIPIDRLFEKCPGLESICPDLEIYPNSWIYADGSRPVIDAERIFGREKELKDIENLLQDKSALVIKGLRGTGKSTLASMFVDRMDEDGKFAGIYWRKMYETTDISDIIGSFFTVIGKPVIDLEHYKIPDQLNLLFKELNEASYLLILDNFEVLLDPQMDKPLESKIGFSDLIEKANENCIRSKILFTSWDSIFSERGLRLSSISIGGLDPSAGILLLKREGVTESDAELKKAVELSDGHPLALVLLAQLINEGADPLSALLNDDSLWIGKNGEVAEKILNKVYNKRLLEDERELLQYISIFRQPVPATAIVAIANDSEWSESKVKRVALNLTRKSLLQKQINGKNYWEESLINKYAGNKIPEKSDAGNKIPEKSEIHKRACKYFLSIPLPSKPAKREDIQSIIEAHYHACMAKDYNMAFDIIFDYEIYQTLDLWGNYTVLVDLYTRMLSEDHFGNEILLENKVNHVAILGNLGSAYYQLGNAKKAIDYYEQALKIAREIGDIRNEGADLGNLGNAYSTLGDAKKAIDYYEQALKIAKEVGDIRNEGNHLGNLGLAYSALGDAKKAIDYYEQALKIAREIGDIRGEGNNFGNLGSAYYQLGNAKKAIDCYEQALKIEREIGDIRNEGADLGNLGSAYYQLGNAKKAIDCYEQALKIAREIGDIRNEGNHLGNLGNAYSAQGDAKKAIDCYEQALKIAREIGDIRNEGNRLGNLGNAYSALGDAKKAIDYYEQALKIAREIGDRWGEGADLGNLGNAYSVLGDAKKAIDYYEQALKIDLEIGDRRGEGADLGNLGSAYRALGDAKKAIDYYEQALKIAREIGDIRGEGNHLGNLGNAYRALGDTKKAIDYYEQALKIAKEIGDIRGEGNHLGNLGNAYRALGNAKKAIDYYEQALKIDPEDESVWYNKACAHSLMNKRSEALVYLKLAVELNPSYRESAKSDKDFEKLWDDQDFKDIIAINQG